MTESFHPTHEFASYFTEREILCHVPTGRQEALIREMVERVAEHHSVGDVEAVCRAVAEREAVSRTLITPELAVPHARLDNLPHPIVAVATSKAGIVFQEGEPPVRLIILVLVQKDRPALYLQILSALGRMFRDPATVRDATALSSAAEVMKFFQRGGMVLPDYVCAGDMMVPPRFTLKDTNSLKEGIDLIVSREITEIPVTDKEGEMVGVVTAAALLSVCMPPYILWMDDLSPFYQFEPFVNVLKNEESSWLADVMTTEYASATIGQPAINVAESMARHGTSTCYITKDKKLVGTVTLPQFLNKVLRD
ncbi:MAG: PTS sugar transporter subunit IIA [Kiritimatiellaeota bacterium]|nr:PTS sugar transporter subunit IIA [Kiritimatiellota bacterium]